MIQEKVSLMVDEILQKQGQDGSWRYCFETGPMTDAYMILLFRTLGIQNENLISGLADRIKTLQQPNGAWKLYADEEEGNLSATIESYEALLASGNVKSDSPEIIAAESFIRGQGGFQKAHLSTRFLLALYGLYPWPRFFPIPYWFMFLPKPFPIRFESFSKYVRVHFASIIILAAKRFSFKLHIPYDHQISNFLTDRQTCRLNRQRTKQAKPIRGTKEKAIMKAEDYLLHSFEKDGTIYNYATATWMAAYALLALGYQRDSPLIQKAVDGLIRTHMARCSNEKLHIQNSPSHIWDTALTSYSLYSTGEKRAEAAAKKAANYLIRIQRKHRLPTGSSNPNRSSIGWGFSENNSINPDVDDTQAALRAIFPLVNTSLEAYTAWREGTRWLMTMQNKDGGWGSFEKGKNQQLINRLPIQNIRDTGTDPSTADITGRVLEFLGSYLKLTIHHPVVRSGAAWLVRHQEIDGSWFGRWGVSYIYGTWAALTGLGAVGYTYSDPSVQKAVKWLLQIQHPHGGWGESCKSDVYRKFTPLPFSTPSQTAWAIEALLAVNAPAADAIEKGISYLIRHQWSAEERTYPTGAGLPGHFYIYYHSYNHIWPLLALTRYLRKYSDAQPLKGGESFAVS